MNLVSLRLITPDVERLCQFYEQLMERAATRYTPDFAELRTPTFTLAFAHPRTLSRPGAHPGADATPPAETHTVIIEFRVDDVDHTFLRCGGLGEVVQPPLTQPWGNRSLLMRDPDGHLLNMFTPVTAQALARQTAGP